MLMHGLLIDAAERTPDKEAFHWVDRARSRSYDGAVEAMRAVAAALHEVGVRPGDRVSVVAHNGMDYLDVMAGCWYLGAIPALVNVKFADELEYYLGDHDPAAIVYTHDIEQPIKRVAPSLPSLRALICMDGPQEGAFGLPDLRDAGFAVPAMATDASAIAHLSYTSGTTGRPKGACLAHEPTVTAARVIGERLRITADDHSMAPGAMSSSNPLVANILPELAVGATIDVMTRWTPESGYRAVRDRGVTLFAGNPPFLQDLYDQALLDEDRAQTLRLRIGLSGGGAVPPRLRAAWTRDLGIALVESYGQSEIGGFVALGFPEPRPADDLSQRVGMPLPDKEIRILGDDDRVLPIGAVGEIALRGGYMKGYWGRPEKTAETLRNGWLHTGDLGSIDVDGWVTLHSRRSELIEVAGQQWYPRDVEEALIALDAVRQAALVAVQRGEQREPVAAIVLAEDADLSADAARLEIAGATGYAVDALTVVFVDAFPLTPTGKIAKATLAAQLAEEGLGG